MHNSRRRFVLGSLGFPAMALLPAGSNAQSTGYKALVCVYLGGGNDGVNTLVPLDSTQYGHYSRARGPLALQRGTSSTSLIELAGAGHGLHPAMRSLADAWTERTLAFVHNVGPLARPTSQAEYLAWRGLGDTSRVPQALFSHSDQTLLWENGDTYTTRNFGWGGLSMSQAPGLQQVVSLAGNTRFAVNEGGGALVLNSNGRLSLPTRLEAGADRALIESLTRNASSNRLASLYSSKQLSAFDFSARLAPIATLAPGDSRVPAGINTAFGDISRNPLAQQLFQVAKLINARDVLGGQQHIFYVSLGGFDTHGNQVQGGAHQGTHANLLEEVATSLVKFRRAMINLGLDGQVTSFTSSEFGRTIQSNSVLGTDHAWGNLQFVLGGAVDGGRLYGDAPSLQVGGPNEAGPPDPAQCNGRWIPTLSVEQYAAPLLRWLNPSVDLQRIFPNASRFALDRLAFMRI
jgi:uncharacterized protein (DUF1501 family)